MKTLLKLGVVIVLVASAYNLLNNAEVTEASGNEIQERTDLQQIWYSVVRLVTGDRTKGEEGSENRNQDKHGSTDEVEQVIQLIIKEIEEKDTQTLNLLVAEVLYRAKRVRKNKAGESIMSEMNNPLWIPCQWEGGYSGLCEWVEYDGSDFELSEYGKIERGVQRYFEKVGHLYKEGNIEEVLGTLGNFYRSRSVSKYFPEGIFDGYEEEMGGIIDQITK